MDFALSVLVSGYISSSVLLFSIGIYYRRLRKISSDLTIATYRSLAAFGLAAFFLVLVPVSGVNIPTFSRLFVVSLLASMVISQIYLTVESIRKVQIATAFIGITVATVFLDGILSVSFGFAFLPSALIIGIMATFLVVSLLGGLYVLKESPSPFTVSMMIVLIVTTFASMTASLGLVSETPQYFAIQVLPATISAGVLASMLRHWRNIITNSFFALVVTVGPSLFIPAFITGNTIVFAFTVALTFTLLCLLLPLSFFLKQAVETRTATALYISLSLIAIGILALIHGNNFAIANSPIGYWDENILYVDWVFGIFAVSSFTMAAIASSFSSNVRHASREVILAFAMILLTLGHPYVRWLEVDGVLIQRWELDPLYLGVMALLVVAFLVFFRISYQLWNAGSGRAAVRFVLFMFAALYLGIVAMFADQIPIDFLVPLLATAGVFLVLSSPRRNPFAES